MLALGKTQLSLLLYLETCAVDQGGLVDQRRMNDEDRALVEAWAESGVVAYGRVRAADLRRLIPYTHWVELAPAAMAAAHAERAARSERMKKNRSWRKAGRE